MSAKRKAISSGKKRVRGRTASMTEKRSRIRTGHTPREEFPPKTVPDLLEKSKEAQANKMDVIGKRLAVLDSRRQDLAKELDVAQKSSDYESFQRVGNNYLGTILESIDLYIDLIREISSESVAGELKNEFSAIVKKGSSMKEIEGQSEWISKDVSPLYEKVRQICACVYASVSKIDQEANRIG